MPHDLAICILLKKRVSQALHQGLIHYNQLNDEKVLEKQLIVGSHILQLIRISTLGVGQ